jgi:hypothetical protein
MKLLQPFGFAVRALVLSVAFLSAVSASAQEEDVDERQEALLESPEAEARLEAISWVANGRTDLSSNVERRLRIAVKLNRMATEDADRNVRVAALLGLDKLQNHLVGGQREDLVAAARAGNRNAAELLMKDERDLPIPEILAAVEPQIGTKDGLSFQFAALLRNLPCSVLARHFNHDNAKLRLALAEALADRLREAQFAKELVARLLGDSDPEVRRCALRTAIELGCDWEQDLDRVDALVHDADPTVASMAMKELAGTSENCGMIVEWLHDENAVIRTRAVEQLNGAHAQSGLAQRTVLRGIDGSLQSLPHMQAVSRLGLTKATPRMAEVALNVDAVYRTEAIEAIATFGREASAVSTKLQLCLRLTNAPSLRQSLALALGEMGPDAAHAACDLEAAIDYAQPMTAIKILESLALIDPSAQRLASILESYRKLITTDTQPGKGFLANGINSKHPYRGHVADSLKRLGVRAAALAPFIAQQLVAAEPKLQAHDALEILEAMQFLNAEACDRVVQYAQDPQQDLELRCRALRLLGRSDQLSGDAKQSLLELLDAEEEAIRHAALRSAPGAGLDPAVVVPKAIAVIEGRSGQPATDAALDCLIGYGPRAADAAEAVARLMCKHQWGRERALRALLAMGPAAETGIPIVVRALKNMEDSGLSVAVDFLSAMAPSSPDAFAALERLGQDPEEQCLEAQQRLALVTRHAEAQPEPAVQQAADSSPAD